MTLETKDTDGTVAYAALSAFQRDLLLAVAALSETEQDCYGLAVKRWIENNHEMEVNHGRLYPNLDTLVEEGYVERGSIDRRTNEYTLTDTGVGVLDAWSRQMERILS